MRVRYIASACVIVEHNGVKVLCDPWLTDGIYYGSWYHYPPLKFGPEDFVDVDFIYISHVHPDHLDPETLKRLPNHIPVIIANYQEKYVSGIIRKCGFTTVIELDAGHTYELTEDFTMQILGADFCDPSVCGKAFDCTAHTHLSTKHIDTISVFHGGGQTIVNTNDCAAPVTISACEYIKSRYPIIDMLLVGYAGAGPYPQCYIYPSEGIDELLERADKKKNQFLDQCATYVERFRPSYFLPFAGQYTLGGQYSHLNAYRGVPELAELDELLTPRITKLETFSRMILLNSGEFFDVERGIPSAPYTPIDPGDKDDYIRGVLSHKRFEFESDPPPGEKALIEMLAVAQSAMIERLQRRQLKPYRSDWNVFLSTREGCLVQISFDCSGISLATEQEIKNPYLIIRLDPRLLLRILERKAHFNNAEIGSHLRFERKPDIYDRRLFICLSYLHLP